MTTDRAWAERFPRLFAPNHVAYVEFTTSSSETDDVNRLHLVAVTAEALVVVCRSAQGWRFLPGGTREPGESVHALAERELLAEAMGLITRHGS